MYFMSSTGFKLLSKIKANLLNKFYNFCRVAAFVMIRSWRHKC